MSDTMPTTQHRPGWSAPFGAKPDPEQELELPPTPDQDTGESPEEELEAALAVSEPEPGRDIPHLVQVGGYPNPDYPEQGALVEEQRASQDVEGEVQTLPVPPAPGPQREHVEYHVVLTERRGNTRRASRTIYVPANNGQMGPTLILPLDQNRRRAVISIIAASNDGWFTAFGDENLEPFSWNFPAGAFEPPPGQASARFLQPCNFSVISAPTTFVYESVRELYALFVPDTTLTNNGQAAVLSIMSEAGDRALAEDDPTASGGDR